MGPLPQWMYHAQLIAPRMKYDLTVPGLTWVDLIFPFFLFSMGASIPLALSRQLDAGMSARAMLAALLRRFAFLAFFAIYVMQISPNVIAKPADARAWWLALLGYGLLFPVMSRLPSAWSRGWRHALRGAGWAAAAGLLVHLNHRAGDSLFVLLSRVVQTSDIIIVVLANMALFGGLAWWLTRESWPARLWLMLFVVGLRLGHSSTGWVSQVWDWSPIPWIFRFSYLQYLLIVLPGTIVGDQLLRWMRAAPDAPTNVTPANEMRPGTTRDPIGQKVGVGLLGLALIITVLVGLQSRRVLETVWACGLIGALGGAVLGSARSSSGALLRSSFGWGMAWLMLGLVLEPFEGGIRKDNPTLSYYFVTSGLACLGLAVFQVCVDHARSRRVVDPLIATGQNPLLAYAGIRSLLAPLMVLTGLERLSAEFLGTPWLGVLRAGIKTAMLAAFVVACTRRRIFWRA